MKYNLDWLKERAAKKENIKYIFFWGHTNKTDEEIGKFVFSQWFPAPFTVAGVEYKTSEHWMMAQKANLFDDQEIFQKVIQAEKPGEAKDLGRLITWFDDAKWNKWKYEIVVEGSIHKFSQNKKLRDYLLSTNDRVLVEASPIDTIWGIGLGQDSDAVENPQLWKGENLLGFALMEARDVLTSLGDTVYKAEKLPWKK